MHALDGNAIAGPLFAVFGREMTAVVGTCGHCGNRAMVAELRVYAQAPGTVARCPSCGGVVLVLTEIRGVERISDQHLGLEPR
jgi:hypothetical protein